MCTGGTSCLQVSPLLRKFESTVYLHMLYKDEMLCKNEMLHNNEILCQDKMLCKDELLCKDGILQACAHMHGSAEAQPWFYCEVSSHDDVGSGFLCLSTTAPSTQECRHAVRLPGESQGMQECKCFAPIVGVPLVTLHCNG